jgi:hypothetical protein
MSSPEETSQLSRCPNCGAELVGSFCHDCGQKTTEPKERTLRYFLFQFFGATFFLENNFLKNIWLLVFRPGYLAKEYFDGRRKRYMTPISLFLLINLFYFFMVSLSDLNLSLGRHPAEKAVVEDSLGIRSEEQLVSVN